jgi:hypothetical protein
MQEILIDIDKKGKWKPVTRKGSLVEISGMFMVMKNQRRIPMINVCKPEE